MTVLPKEKTNISVDTLEKITNTDLADLCYNAEQAIKAGGGFGWITVPPRDVLKKILEFHAACKHKYTNSRKIKR